MKKTFCLMISLLLLLGLAACSGNNNTIKLSFDKKTAYFTASKTLLPISGDTLSDGDIYEQASVTLSCEPLAMRLFLSIKLDDPGEITDGVKIKVGDNVFDLKNGTQIYDSVDPVTSVTLNIIVYLSKDIPSSMQNKAIGFAFELAA